MDGEKHVRVSMAMDTIMSHVSEHKNDSSLMYMCTPTDVYAVPEEVIEGSNTKFKHRSKFETVFSKGIATLSLKQFFSSPLLWVDIVLMVALACVSLFVPMDAGAM